MSKGLLSFPYLIFSTESVFTVLCCYNRYYKWKKIEMHAQTFAKKLEILDWHQVKGKNSQSDIHQLLPIHSESTQGSRILLGFVSLVKYRSTQIRCLFM